MKGEAISEEVVPQFMGAFEALVRSNLSQEVMRSLSLFITYAFHLPVSMGSRTPRLSLATSRSSTPGPFKRGATDGPDNNSLSSGSRSVSKKQLGTKVLSLYSRILCERGNFNNIKKFAKTVTNKVGTAEHIDATWSGGLADILGLNGSGFSIYLLMTIPRLSSTVARFLLAFSLSTDRLIRQSLLVNPAASPSWQTG